MTFLYGLARMISQLSYGNVKLARLIEERKRAEEALRESEDRFRSLAAASSDVMYRMNADWSEMCQLSGGGFLADTGAPSRDWLHEYIHPDDQANVMAVIQDSIRTQSVFEMEHRVLCADGTVGWTFSRAIPRLNANGEIFEWFGSASDITERKQAEERAKKEYHETALINRILRVFVEERGDTLFDKVLAIIQESLGSLHGVFGFISEPGHLICPSLSKMLDACEIEGKCIHYPPEKWKGLWARALKEKRSLYTNDAPPVPPGHPIIHNNLATPILFHGDVIGLLSLANKEGGYTEQDRDMLETIAARIAPILYAWIQRKLREDEHDAAEEQIRRAAIRFEMLAETASKLLESKTPQQIIDSLCSRVMAFLDCHVFINYLVDERLHRLHLNASGGLTEKTAGDIEWLDFGQAICGRVAQEGKRIVAENIQESCDARADLVRSFGIKAYACHPIMAQGKVIGTLSFGTRSRKRFSEDDLSTMKIVTDQVATAMKRKQAEEAVQASYEDLARFNRLAVDRELRMIELKNEINALCEQAGRPPQYAMNVLDRTPAVGGGENDTLDAVEEKRI